MFLIGYGVLRFVAEFFREPDSYLGLLALKNLRVAVKLNSAVSDVDKPYQDRIIALAEFLKKKVTSLSYTAAPAFTDDEAYENYITLLRATATKRMSAAEIDAARDKARTFDPGDKSYVPLMTRAFALSHSDWLMIASCSPG